MDVKKLMEETAKHYEMKMDKLFQSVRELEIRCEKLQTENRKLRKDRAEMIREIRKGKKNGKHRNH